MKTHIAVLRVSVIVCAVVIATLSVAISSASAADLRRVVVFRDGISSQVQQQVVAASGSRALHVLSLINGVSIELPTTNTQQALTYLRSHPAVAGVYDDPTIGANGQVDAITAGAGGDGAGGDGAGGDGAGGDATVFVMPVPPPSKEVYPWGIQRIGAARLQDDQHDFGDGVKVAVFDTGIDRTHPDLAPNIVGGFNAIAGAPDPSNYDDDNGHGTAMAGIIAAGVNRFGVIGAAPHARLVAVKLLDKNGKGHTSDVIYALGVIASRQDIRVINMSFGTSIDWPLFPIAIQRTVETGKIIVASRGNRCTTGSSGAVATGAGGDGAGGDGAGGDGAGGDGAGGDGAGGDGGCSQSAVRFPAAYPEVIAVGASTRDDRVATYSLWAGTKPTMVIDPTTMTFTEVYLLPRHVDVVAPGGSAAGCTSSMPSCPGRILTTNVGGGYGEVIGTSPAAAHVTGAVALALQVRRHVSPAQMQDLLRRTATPLTCPPPPTVPTAPAGCPAAQQGAGLVNAEALVDALQRSHDDD